MDIILYLLSLVGLTFIVTHGEIFDYLKGRILKLGHQWDEIEDDKIVAFPNKGYKSWLRILCDKLFYYVCCPQCIGFLVGILFSHYYKPFMGNVFLDGCLLSGLCYIVVSLTERKADN